MEPAVEWPEGRYDPIPKLRGYDVDSSGQRVLVRKKVEKPNGNLVASRFDRVVLFENFTSYLKKKVPPGEPNP